VRALHGGLSEMNNQTANQHYTETSSSSRSSDSAHDITETSPESMQEALQVLQKNKDQWAETGIDERIKIIDEIKRDMLPVFDRWVALSLEAKGFSKHSHDEGWEWFYLGFVFNMLAILRHVLMDIKKYGHPQISELPGTRSSGRVSVKVFPTSISERMQFPGESIEVWMEPGASIEEIFQTQIQTKRERKGVVNLVLAAGNASPLPVSDFMTKLFIANHVVIIKLNPVNAYLGPLIEEGFKALINKGFLRVVYGGASEGSYLCNHPLVDEIHLMGSDKTFETIVFGQGPDGTERKVKKDPLVTKSITGELSNVSPVIIVPGPWDDGDLMKQALKITSWLAINAGCLCFAPRVLVQNKNWAQREALIKAISDVMRSVPTHKAFYPGSKERHAAFIAAHPDAFQFGDSSQGHLPWTLIADVDPNNKNDICFTTDAFCSLFAETALEASSIPEYIDKAVDFVNRTLWGTLSAYIIIHPKSLRDSKIAASLERALANLCYGTISINETVGLVWVYMRSPWGGYPGHDIYNVQSGIGFNNNVYMFNRPEKTIVRGTFNKIFDPSLVTFKNFPEFCKKFAFYSASPSIWKMPGMLWSMMRG
jgi:acyl-CoA reductase-like NAD-dependent aldehyde dehydrogenase